jgi:hypothetical protein
MKALSGILIYFTDHGILPEVVVVGKQDCINCKGKKISCSIREYPGEFQSADFPFGW